MSLVYVVLDNQEENIDKNMGTREKKYRDGRLEVFYSNGNRWDEDNLAIHLEMIVLC